MMNTARSIVVALTVFLVAASGGWCEPTRGNGEQVVGVARKTNPEDRILGLINRINQIGYYTYGPSHNEMVEDAELRRLLRLTFAYGYRKNAMLLEGDYDIMSKALSFTRHCISSDWVLIRGEEVDPSMKLVKPDKARDYFVSTFSESEIRLLEHELQASKLARDIQRERLLTKAGYTLSTKLKLPAQMPTAYDLALSGSTAYELHKPDSPEQGDLIPMADAPYVVNNTLMVPMKDLFTWLNLRVEHDRRTGSITATGDCLVTKRELPAATILATTTWTEHRKATFRADGKVAIVNGVMLYLSVPPAVINGRVFIPIDFVGEASGAATTWDPKTKTATVAQGSRLGRVVAKTELKSGGKKPSS